MVERITITIDEPVLAAIDDFMAERGYGNRSEAMRDLLRRALGAMASQPSRSEWCAACVSYVYNFTERELVARLSRLLHDQHDLTISTLRVGIDHHHSFEAVTITGETSRVLTLTDALVSERGVKFGQVNLIPLQMRGDAHRHAGESGAHAHLTPAL